MKCWFRDKGKPVNVGIQPFPSRTTAHLMKALDAEEKRFPFIPMANDYHE